jgi:outer membrane protein assembly factor BamB
MATSPLVANDILRQVGLGQVWQAKLAVKEGEQIENLYLLGDTLYALTSTNYLFAVHCDSGDVVFGMQLAQSGFPVLEPRLYENQLLVVAGNQVLQIDIAGGAVTHTQKFDYTVVCPAVRNATNLYAAGMDNRIHATGIEKKNFLFEAAANNDSMPTTILATNGYVVFATDKGNVVGIAAAAPQRLWQFDARDKITAQIVGDGNDVYAASWDTNLYKLKTSTGRLMWKYQLGGILKNSPRVTQGVVYQYVPNRGVTAIDKEGGQLLWTVDDGIEFLAEINGTAYLMTDGRTVAAVNNTTHKQIGTINFAQVRRYAINTHDGKMYVGDTMGRIACIAAAK